MDNARSSTAPTDNSQTEHATTSSAVAEPRFRRRCGRSGALVDFDPTTVAVSDLRASLPTRRVARSQRRPRRRGKSPHLPRNVVVEAPSVVTGAVVDLESILEWKLFVRLDRPRVSTFLLAQPMIINLPESDRRHTPDLLQIGVDGQFTVWDCHDPRDDIDTFSEVAAETKSLLNDCGWRHETLTEFPVVEWCNLATLLPSRTVDEPSTNSVNEIRDLIANGANTIDAILAASNEDRSLRTTLWEMVWRGDLNVDLTTHITPDTMLEAQS